jgi:hypothetical protein
MNEVVDASQKDPMDACTDTLCAVDRLDEQDVDRNEVAVVEGPDPTEQA